MNTPFEFWSLYESSYILKRLDLIKGLGVSRSIRELARSESLTDDLFDNSFHHQLLSLFDDLIDYKDEVNRMKQNEKTDKIDKLVKALIRDKQSQIKRIESEIAMLKETFGQVAVCPQIKECGPQKEAPKRGRGRPPKEVPKRGRGRPPKEAPKRGRGRPRKD